MSENKDGKKVLNDFLTIEEKVGKGQFCTVYRANGYYADTDETIPYALKAFRTQTLNGMCPNTQISNLGEGENANSLGMTTHYKMIMNEVKFWGKLKHDNVCKAFVWFEDYKPNGHDKMYLMLQYADLGTLCNSENKVNQRIIDFLTQKISTEQEFKQFYEVDSCLSMKERIARFIFSQVANGVEYLHDVAFVANRDIKPENILFTTKAGGTNCFSHDRAQITDFTTAFKLQKETADIVKTSGYCGSPGFMAPEAFTDHDFKPQNPRCVNGTDRIN